MPEPINPEVPQAPEEAETRPEATAERQEAEALQGAQILESPPDGSFVHGLQTFIAWVQSLLAKDHKD